MYEKATFYEPELALGKVVLKHVGPVLLKSIILITRNALST